MCGYYRLASFIEYKAKLSGIRIEYVNTAFTSQMCLKCGSVHHANDRNYSCKCGYHTHRDLLGAINICDSTDIFKYYFSFIGYSIINKENGGEYHEKNRFDTRVQT